MGGALALLAALEAAAAPLRVLDLGGNELCGGTVAEDHSFGAVQGAAARLSEHNQLCRLDADGLCSAGPKMLPDSGVYRIEFEVVQATDGDGPISLLDLPQISPTSPLYLCMSRPIPPSDLPLYLCISPLHLPYLCRRPTATARTSA